MDGDIAPIAELCDVAEAHGAMTYLDEVHAVGLYGPRGGGIAEREGADAPADRHRGHARQGLRRRSAATSRPRPRLCDFVRSFASGFIFTTALPPAVAAGALRQHPPPEGQLGRARRASRSASPRSAARLDAAGIPHLDNPSHIVPVMVRDPVPCKRISDMLLDHYGIYVQPINYPTVPRGTERLRITPSPLHTDADIDHLVSSLAACWSELELKQAA